MASTTMARARTLATGTFSGKPVILNFGYFIDTHVDSSGETFSTRAIPRGFCRPTLVHYAPPGPKASGLGILLFAEGALASDVKASIDVSEGARFLSVEWFEDWRLGELAETGELPGATTRGLIPTRNFRDHRRRIYLVKPLRQLVLDHEKAARKGTSK